MSRRSHVRAAFVLGLALLSMLASPALGVSRNGVWRGMTSQDRVVRFEVRRERIVAVRISVYHEACNLVVAARARNTDFDIRDDGRFTMRFFGADDTGDRVVVRGEFTSRRRAKGVLRSIQDGADCHDSVRATWRVRRDAA